MVENQPETCILVATFDRQLSVAQLTKDLIDLYWREHPITYFCGTSHQGDNYLPLRCDSRDWMNIVYDACLGLKERGYQRIYLILDDQGPLDHCHSTHLNQTIPSFMAKLDASYISIRGWDHRRNSRGSDLGKEFLHLQHQDRRYRWKFALHPALWNIEALVEILSELIVDTDLGDRTAWAFEIRSGVARSPRIAFHSTRTFRVHGRLMSQRPGNNFLRLVNEIFDSLVRNIDSILHKPLFRRNRWPSMLRSTIVTLLGTDRVFYDGPFPMPYSGLLIKGRINPFVKQWLTSKNKKEILQKLEKAAAF